MRFVSLGATGLLLAALLLVGGCAGLPAPSSKPATSPTPGKPAQPHRERFADPALANEYQQALSAMRAGDTTRARALLEAIVEQEPGLAGPQLNLGILLLDAGDYAAAEERLRKAAEIAPKSAIAQTQLGLALRHLGRFQEAETAYLAALASDPEYPLAHRNLGILYDLYLQQPEKALPHYQRYRELSAEAADEVGRWIAELQQRLKKGTN